MGVPAFFRWLSRKYASIVVTCVEEKPKVVDDVRIPVDSSQPNPNDVEFDNLYLDMNGIIHPCCHPENKPAPKNEDEMMVLIFEYIDRIFSIVRPRRLLYMAIDGVAPRAKMNQQRSRRFRASKETLEKIEDVSRIKSELRAKGLDVPPDKPAGEHFDSNCITPGTPFMHRLAVCLRYYVHDRLNNDPGWQDIQVILSDANVPGEGEHKIMDYIRRQRAQPHHDPNTHHCLCGADADLIMLGLATHEPYFTIIREEFKQTPRPCDICGQTGHEMKDCQGLAKQKEGEHDELAAPVGEDVQFIFLRLNILREYLLKELHMSNLPFKQDMERAIDDWVFMCFFVGNDFLPHLPSLEIREGAIDRLVSLYKKAVYKTGGYLTENGFVNLDRVQLVLSDLGEVEDEIFKKRRTSDIHFKRRNKERRHRERKMANAQRPSFMLGGQFKPQVVGSGARAIESPRQTAADMRLQANSYSTISNQNAASALRSMLTTGEQERHGEKRKLNEDSDSEEEPQDEVKLWESGWKERYYQSKFTVDEDDIDFRHIVAHEYVLGLCWVLRYYYQGVPAWNWYFPYHYAPFASDFVNISEVDTKFPLDTKPFNPLEQLMSVFPAASKKHLPQTWQILMDNPESDIIDFYPTDFKIDLNGKKYAWQGVALLPFVDETRLYKALESVYPDLTPDEKYRNTRGSDRLFVSKKHPVHDFLEALYEDATDADEPVGIDTKLTKGVLGDVWCDECVVLSGKTVKSPLDELEDLKNNQAICVKFRDPQFEPGHVFPATILPEAKFPDPVLKQEDFDAANRGGYRPQLGFQRGSHHRGRGSYGGNETANRFVSGSLGSQGRYGSVPPPTGRGFNNKQGQDYNTHGHSRRGGGGGGGYQGSTGGYSSHGSNVQQSWQSGSQQSAYQQNQHRGYNQTPAHRSGGYGGGSGYGGGGGYGGQSGGRGGQSGSYGGQSGSYGGRSGQSGGYGGGSGGYGGQDGGGGRYGGGSYTQHSASSGNNASRGQYNSGGARGQSSGNRGQRGSHPGYGVVSEGQGRSGSYPLPPKKGRY